MTHYPILLNLAIANLIDKNVWLKMHCISKQLPAIAGIDRPKPLNEIGYFIIYRSGCYVKISQPSIPVCVLGIVEILSFKTSGCVIQ